jgi:phosphonate transport system permease protein
MAIRFGIEREQLAARHVSAVRGSTLRRFAMPFGLVACILYTAYCWWFFSIGAVLQRADWSIAGAYLADWVSYESRPDIRLHANRIEVRFPRFDPFGENPKVEWLTTESAMVEIGAAAQVSGGGTQSSGGSFMAPGAPTGTDASASAPPPQADVQSGPAEAVVRAKVEFGGARFTIVPGSVVVERGAARVEFAVDTGRGVVADGPLPAWIEQKEPGAIARIYLGLSGRVEIDSDEVSIRRRFPGWENFVFDVDSPFWGKSSGAVVSMLVYGERIRPDQSNLALAWNNFLNNAEWQHYDVWLKLLQTVVMAFVGTILASLIAFPLSFLAARNITPSRIANQGFKRFFDFLRSVDMLIWALFFTRAFGPGPLAGMSAIFFTDTGTLGKLYGEALENIDDRQREGVRSVGAAPALVQRYGVLPQVLPVFLSQSLYFWESNTRSATIIGAVGAGGIGLKLWEAMRTNQDWENVFYMVILILVVVYVFDGISNYLRQMLIGRAR